MTVYITVEGCLLEIYTWKISHKMMLFDLHAEIIWFFKKMQTEKPSSN